MWKNKKVLITGGAGFIGSALAKNLLNLGAKVSIIDNFERGSLDYLRGFDSDIEIIKGNLLDYDTCDQAISGKDIVYHMASKVGGIGYYTSKPYEVMSENIKIDSNVLNACINNKINKYFYASSAHVYPKSLQTTNSPPAIKENQTFPADPELSYGWAKLISEKQIEYACKEYPFFNAAIARYIGIYGENQDFKLETGSVIPVFCNRAINYPNIKFSVWGTGQETRSYCFIDDAIEATIMMVEKLDSQQIVGPLNIGKQEIVKIEEIANNIIEISGKDIEIEYDRTKETLIWGQWCDCQLAKETINWEAKTSFKDGLKIVYNDIKRRIK